MSVGNVVAIFIWHLSRKNFEIKIKLLVKIFESTMSSLDLHRMLYRDIMAMFLGIDFTVLVIAIPEKFSV